jgi:hypothetical protein
MRKLFALAAVAVAVMSGLTPAVSAHVRSGP